MNLTSLLRSLNNKIFSAKWAALFLLGVLLIGVGIFFVLHERAVSRQHTATDTDWSLIGRQVSERDHTIGNVNAPIQVIVYADFECKYCADLFKTDIPKLQAKFGEQIVIAYRHLPLPIYPGSEVESEASECVYQLGGNDAFWKFAREMFSLPKGVKKTNPDVLLKTAVSAGVDGGKFTTCMQQGGGKARVEEDKIEGSIAGMTMTPSLLLKSAHRALVISGNYYSQIYTGINYLLDTNNQIAKRR